MCVRVFRPAPRIKYMYRIIDHERQFFVTSSERNIQKLLHRDSKMLITTCYFDNDAEKFLPVSELTDAQDLPLDNGRRILILKECHAGN